MLNHNYYLISVGSPSDVERTQNQEDELDKVLSDLFGQEIKREKENDWKIKSRSQYIQAKARQAQRQSSAFPGCPTLQECLTEVIRDLSWIGCKDVYI